MGGTAFHPYLWPKKVTSIVLNCIEFIFMLYSFFLNTSTSAFRDAAMSSLPEAMRSLTQVFTGKLQDFTDEVENVHMLWLEEIQQEAQRMFSRSVICNI